MGRAYIAGMLGMLAVTAGCPGDPPPSVDAGDMDGGDTDGGGGESALTFEFVAKPELPTEPDGEFEVRITESTYVLGNVRAVGDAAPGDSRTSRASFEIKFHEAPVRLPFPEAPQGIYSFLFADVMSYEVKGTVTIGTGDGGLDTFDFEIHDQPPELELAVDLAGLTVADQPVTCIIEMDLRRITREVDWASLEPDGEEGIEVEVDYPDIGRLRDRAGDFRKQ